MDSASWMVRYNDGTELTQYDSTSPFYVVESGEVPYKAIAWAKVEELILSSPLVESRFNVVQPPEGYQLSLRSRHMRTSLGDAAMCFIVLVSVAGELPEPHNTISLVYWLPDGTTHECPNFNCPDVAQYCSDAMAGRNMSLAPATRTLTAGVDVHSLTAEN